MKLKSYLLLIFLSLIQFSNAQNAKVIVRLNHVLLDKEVVNDQEIIQTTIGNLLNEQGFQELNSLNDLGLLELSSLSAKKLFPHLTTNDSISIGRQGNRVRIPPFYATFSITAPDSMSENHFIRSLERYYPVVIYAHPVYEIEYQNIPNDTLYTEQLSLYNDSLDSAHINIEGAWAIETGKQHIKVGVFDTGIDTTHEDLQVLIGYSYENFLLPDYGTDIRGHGTAVAGIIGARGNNDSTGIAGIAGGNGLDTSGVSLLDFAYGNGSVAEVEYFSTAIVDAARAPYTYYDWSPGTAPDQLPYWNNAPGYGIYIGNHSYNLRRSNEGPGDGGAQSGPTIDTVDVGGGGDGPGGTFAKCDLCKESFLFSMRNGVVNVVSRGNIILGGINNNDPYGSYNDPKKIPAAYPDSWILSVGACGDDGNRLIGGVNTGLVNEGWFSPQGREMDVLAPGTKATVVTTLSDSTSNTGYVRFNGTSAAAPHVSGVAALLLSKYNKNCYSQLNLDPADVEYIIEQSAVDVDSSGYDVNSGWGRLDATAAMDMIDFPTLQIVHPHDSIISTTLIQTDTISIQVAETFYSNTQGPYSTNYPLDDEVDYRVERLKYEMQYYFGDYILPTTDLLDVWVRHSQTNSLGLYNDTTAFDTLGVQFLETIDTFDVAPMAQIESFTDTTITLSGYYYHFIGKYDPVNGVEGSIVATEDYWYPIDPFNDTLKMAYSIYIRDSTLLERYDFSCEGANALLDSLIPTLGHDELTIFDGAILYPNPAKTVVKMDLEVGFNGDVVLLDVQGRIIEEILAVGDQKHFEFDIANLTSGVYFITLNGEKPLTLKWIKE
ncbi:MAG: S8 family serine peptidase [Fluviicola sp.]